MLFVGFLAFAGLLLVFLEFFLPTGIMAIGGGVLLLSSLFVFHMTQTGLLPLLSFIALILGALYLCIRLATWSLRAQGKLEPYRGLEKEQSVVYSKELIGKMGIAATDLKPSGQILLESRHFDALSKTGPILKGTAVQITKSQGSHLVVEAETGARP